MHWILLGIAVGIVFYLGDKYLFILASYPSLRKDEKIFDIEGYSLRRNFEGISINNYKFLWNL